MPPLATPKDKLDELFVSWLSTGDTLQTVMGLIESFHSSGALSLPSLSLGGLGDGPGDGPGMVMKSPRKAPMSPRSPSTRSSPRHERRGTDTGSSKGSPVVARRASSPLAQVEPVVETQPEDGKKEAELPRFYFPNGAPVDPKVLRSQKLAMQVAVKEHPDGLPEEAFNKLVHKMYGLPSFVCSLAFIRLAGEEDAVHMDLVKQFWDTNLRGRTKTEQLFNVLRDPDNKFITVDNLKMMVGELLDVHPGLQFLSSTPEFQHRYMETVVTRIMYEVNRSETGRISLSELRRSNLAGVLDLVASEPDINKVLDYFSYEHFYVIYYLFWELDTDHDLVIDFADLHRYANRSLGVRVLRRIFQGAPRKLSAGPGRMSFEDFIWFVLSEEDKTTDTAIRYWFRCVDYDGDGYISTFECEYFFEEQLDRMESLGFESIPFEDILCQLLDMIQPDRMDAITMRDIRKTSHASFFFNALFNLTKFIAEEHKDACAPDEDGLTDWDRFARRQYSLAAQEESDDDLSDDDISSLLDPLTP